MTNLKGDHHKPWEHIARQLGDYDIEDTGSSFNSHREMVRVDSEFYVGDWVDAEAACERIAGLEAEKEKWMAGQLGVAMKRRIAALEGQIQLITAGEIAVKDEVVDSARKFVEKTHGLEAWRSIEKAARGEDVDFFGNMEAGK